MSCCMREPMETAQSHGDDTRVVVARPKWAREHGLHTECGPLCRSMDRLIDVCSNEDEERSERKTPTPFCGNKQTEIRSKDEDITTHDKKCSMDRTGQDTSTGHFECAHHLSSVFCRCSDGGPIRLLVFARRRLSWRSSRRAS